MDNIKPTLDMYKFVQNAFDYFNEHLFDGSLKECLITPSLCSTCTKQKFKIGGINRLFSLIQLIRPLPHNLTVTILRLYHNPIFL